MNIRTILLKKLSNLSNYNEHSFYNVTRSSKSTRYEQLVLSNNVRITRAEEVVQITRSKSKDF